MASSPSAAQWPTYHGNNARTGVTAATPLKPPLRRAWGHHLDAAVYAQPIVAAGLVVVATENNTVYAFRPASGRQVWRRHLGAPVRQSSLPCGNIDPLGITGTPAYDAATGSMFVVTETTGARHILHALNVRTGKQRWKRGVDVAPGRNRAAQQQRSALLVANKHVYVAFGGLYGDCDNYVGYVAGVPASGHGSTTRYIVPTAREAGMWAAAGPVQIAGSRNIYVASGNGAEVGGKYDGSDSVIRLSPGLHKLSLFAPSTWSSDNASDLDLGSSAPVPLSDGNLVIAGKRGTVYLLKPSLGGIGGQLAAISGCAAYGGAARVGRSVILPCSDGIRRLDVSGQSLRWVWHVSGVGGSPVIAGTVVYALNQDTGELIEIGLARGHRRAAYDVGSVTRFATPAPVGRFVYVGTTGGIVAVRGSK